MESSLWRRELSQVQSHEPLSLRKKLSYWLAFSLLFGVLVFCLEGILALAGLKPLAKYKYSEDFFHENQLGIVRFEQNHHSLDFYDPCMSEGTNIAFFGGSNLLWPNSHSTFPHFIEEAFKKDSALSTLNYSFVNAGAEGRDSWYLRHCYQQMDRTQLQWVIIYAGHNDVINLGLRTPKNFIFLRKNPWLIDVINFVQGKSRIYTGLSLVINSLFLKNITASQVEKADIAKNQQIIAQHFANNLRVVIEDSRNRGIKVLLVHQIGNLLESETVKRCSDKGIKWSYCPEISKARKKLDDGHFKEAYFDLSRAKDQDYLSSISSHNIKDVLLEFSEKNDFVYFFDFESYMIDTYAEEGLGCNFFGGDFECDNVHINIKGHKILADRILDIIKPKVLGSE